MGDVGYTPDLVPRLCHIVRWPDFNGYGFNLHAEKGKAGQFIGKVDEGSPAEAAGLKAGDRIVEVNGTNIGNENHQQVVGRIKAGGDETRLLVVDQQTDQHYKETKKVVRGDLPEVKFLSAARDEEDLNVNEVAQGEDGIPAAVIGGDANGADMEAQSPAEDASQYVPRLCNLCKWPDFDGYGFNLHAEKDKPGQYIGLVDPDSPAEVGGLREGDRIIEVNGDNIEASNHTVVIQKIKSGGEKTSMLVVDKDTDDYFKRSGQTICSSMTSVAVISTPPRLAETTEGVTAVVAERVESAPVPEESLNVHNGPEEVGVDMAAVEAEARDVELAAQEDMGGGVVVDYHPYEEVEITKTTTVSTTYQEEISQGTAPNGINGGSVGESQQEVVVSTPTYEPEPAVVHSTTITTPAPMAASDDDINLNLSAAEMKQRLKARKKQDPRQSRTSFEAKYKMFEKM